MEQVEADVGRDPVQPRTHRGPAGEAVGAAPGPDQGLLHRVLGVERRAEHPVAVGGQLLPVLLELAELGPVGDGRFLHQSDSRLGAD